ncbi:hypothetical protein DPMN_084720 [Dreissena polymorpha]|uniref:Uncharacterized protein n=1 Tax=Dreissena polymorpha TaxID=45954 RepID=A0A9D3YET6_DREPO|nr:hypothetical protein DPMN_084720 [Dreissena polymorpha]
MPPTPSAAWKYFTTSSDKKSPIQVTIKRGNFKRLTVKSVKQVQRVLWLCT